MLFNSDFANNTILSCFFLNYFFLIPALLTQIVDLVAELTIPVRIPNKVAKQKLKYIQ